MTLRRRLVAILALSLALLWAAVALWMFLDVRQQLRGALDERLAASARMVAALVSRLPPERLQAGAAAEPLDVVARDGLACEVSLLRGELSVQPLARTASSPGLEQAPAGWGTRTIAGRRWRTYVLHEGGLRIATADRIEAREALLREIALAAAVPFGVALAGSLAVLWWGVGRGLRPIERVRAALAGRPADSGAPLPAIDAPPELRPLIETIRGLLARVQAAIARERRFTDDAAHELRTPLTAIKTHLQVLRLAWTQPDAREVAEQALASADSGVARLQHTLEQLLALARLDGAPDVQAAASVDARDAARLAAADFSAQAQRRLVVRTPAEAARIAMPQALLVSALRNLLDNALRHGPPGSPVELRIDALCDGQVRFVVLDEGPGLSAQECQLAPQRFWRRNAEAGGGIDGIHGIDGSDGIDSGGSSNSDGNGSGNSGSNGSGLGLSIVEAIARRHGGSLVLRPRPGRGLEAELRLPGGEPAATPRAAR